MRRLVRLANSSACIVWAVPIQPTREPLGSVHSDNWFRDYLAAISNQRQRPASPPQQFVGATANLHLSIRLVLYSSDLNTAPIVSFQASRRTITKDQPIPSAPPTEASHWRGTPASLSEPQASLRSRPPGTCVGSEARQRGAGAAGRASLVTFLSRDKKETRPQGRVPATVEFGRRHAKTESL